MDRLVNRSLLTILATLLVAAVLVPDFARADDVVEKVVVRNRKYTTWNKFEVTPSVGFSLTNRLYSHTNLQLGLGYNFSETFGLELRGGWAFSSLNSVGEAVEKSIKSAPDSGQQKEFPDTWRVQWQGLVLPRWTPIYGKLNLVTELPIHFQAYLTAGGGAVGLERESFHFCTGDVCEESTRSTWTAAVGGGMRVFLSDMVLLRLELLNLTYPDEYRVDFKIDEQGAVTDPGAVEKGLSNLLMFNLGASVVF